MPDFTQSDRDLLIKMPVKIDQICSSVGKLEKKIDKLSDKIDDNTKTYITKRMFCWVNGFIIILVISLFGYAATVNTQVTKNTVCIEKLEGK